VKNLCVEIQSPPELVVATFPGREQAAACCEALQNNGFEKPWMAVIRPAHGEDIADAFATTAPSQHEIAATSEGPIAALGRFFTGAGNSLRRALEEHGVHPDVAQAIDRDLQDPGAVVVASTEGRRDLAEEIVVRSGGRVAEGPGAGD
jgi:hypothetical protein